MNETSRTEIIIHAKEEFPREACGLLINVSGKEIYKRCKNLSEKDADFILDPMDYIRAEDSGHIIAVVHSHCNVTARPSQADLVSCELSQLPWIIFSLPSETWHEFEPSGYKAGLLGRTFSHGVLDCYSLIRDWYKENLNVELLDFHRVEEWWKKGDNLYLDNFEKAGFEKCEDLKCGDVILMQIGSDTVNHAGVYIGNDQMIHHSQGRLSCRVVYGGHWKKCTRLVVRYRGAA